MYVVNFLHAFKSNYCFIKHYGYNISRNIVKYKLIFENQ